MRFAEYQERTQDTAQYSTEENDGIYYTSFGLASEAGEVAGKIKKVMRDNDGCFTPEKRKEIADEIGDVLWYCSQLSREIGIPLETIAYNNLEKLRSRKERGKIQGSGDVR
jgi:NTP pyrophosphatase (non-canonical NTP hydrolase)